MDKELGQVVNMPGLTAGQVAVLTNVMGKSAIIKEQIARMEERRAVKNEWIKVCKGMANAIDIATYLTTTTDKELSASHKLSNRLLTEAANLKIVAITLLAVVFLLLILLVI